MARAVAAAADAIASKKTKATTQPKKVGTNDGAGPKTRQPPSGFIRLPAANAKPRKKAKRKSDVADSEDLNTIAAEKLREQEDDRRTDWRQNRDPMPWMGRRAGYDHPNLFLYLHDEILDFVVFVSPTQRELALRHSLVNEMRAMVVTLWSSASLETFGSHNTQMFLSYSDIVVVVFGVLGGTSPLHQLAKALRKSRTSNDVQGSARTFPLFRPLALVLKYFLAQRGLNETYTGGVGSFLIQLLVVSFLQHRRRSLGAEYAHPQHNNLGQLLLAFFTFYGCDFNYANIGISVRAGGSYFLKKARGWSDWNSSSLLSVENPNEPTIDVGKNSYNISTVRRAFDFARQVLTNELHRRGQFDPLPGSILGMIIPPDSDLVERTPPSEFGFEVLRAAEPEQ